CCPGRRASRRSCGRAWRRPKEGMVRKIIVQGGGGGPPTKVDVGGAGIRSEYPGIIHLQVTYYPHWFITAEVLAEMYDVARAAIRTINTVFSACGISLGAEEGAEKVDLTMLVNWAGIPERVFLGFRNEATSRAHNFGTSLKDTERILRLWRWA